jgi:murein tripeptide amidase MpaA
MIYSSGIGLVIAFCFLVDGADDKLTTTQKHNAKPLDVNRDWGVDPNYDPPFSYFIPMAQRDWCETP